MKSHAYICLWEFEENAPNKSCWKFIECYGIDDDGYLCTESKYADTNKCSYNNWINRKIWYDDEKSYTECPKHLDEDDFDYENIPGRVVTIWTFSGGVDLLEFNSPVKNNILSIEFFEKLKTLNWSVLVRDGYNLKHGTAKRVKDFIFKEV